MEIYLLYRYRRVILVNKSNNMAFASFSKKDVPFEYLYNEYLKQEQCR